MLVLLVHTQVLRLMLPLPLIGFVHYFANLAFGIRKHTTQSFRRWRDSAVQDSADRHGSDAAAAPARTHRAAIELGRGGFDADAPISESRLCMRRLDWRRIAVLLVRFLRRRGAGDSI